jgi:hypothetical protein
MGRAEEDATPQPRAGPFGGGAATSSCIVFQRLQAGHCPSHFGLDWPHSAQAKTVLVRLAARVMRPVK